jgi:hypothetical protein
MASYSLEMIHKLKSIAMKGCEDRILEARRQSGKEKKEVIACRQYGVTSVLKNKHGL